MIGDEHKKNVARVQSALRTLYKNGENVREVFVDGIFGDETAEAVKHFQRNEGLPENGEVDYETWSLLMEKAEFYRQEPAGIKPFLNNDKSLALPGERKPAVYFAQAMMLLASSEYSGFDGVEINGINSGKTLEVLRDLQEKMMLSRRDGALDLETWNAQAGVFECCNDK